MLKRACITLDLEPDYAGRIKPSLSAPRTQQIKQLLVLLKKYNVRLSVFVVGSIVRQNAEIIDLFKQYGAEFYLHSYSHTLTSPDSEREIAQGVKAFCNHFHYKPLGYRAPEGRISDNGMRLLKKYGFLFDSSVFPSFWPSPKYLRYPTGTYRDASGVIEIPYTVISPLRLIFSLSWIKLFGWNFYQRLVCLCGLPSLIVFGYHLHDLWRSPSYNRLPLFWNVIYGRNQNNGMYFLENVLRLLSSRHYQFVTLGRVAQEL